MAQRDLPLALQLVGALLVVDEAAVRLDHRAALGLRLLKLDGVFLEGGVLPHGDVEARVPADDEGHLLLPQVLHGEGGGHPLLGEGIGHGEGKVEGIYLPGGFIGGELQGDGVLPLLLHRKLRALGKAVAVHLHPLPVNPGLVLPQGPHDGEQHRGVLPPVGGVPHPQVLGAVRPFQGRQLGPVTVHLGGELPVFQLVDHQSSSLSVSVRAACCQAFSSIIAKVAARRKKRFALSPLLCYHREKRTGEEAALCGQ